ncbi:hypothetical protein, partial [Desulforamulus profundi]|uniref:hypothetical protein n=1 Tax=Desulforamulus profundi TaxID=1383067 RepID=UPI001EE6156E
MTLLVSFEFVPQKVNLQVGQISPSTIYAPKSVVYVDQEKTAEERRRLWRRYPGCRKSMRHFRRRTPGYYPGIAGCQVGSGRRTNRNG